jgi:hypothetical protein
MRPPKYIRDGVRTNKSFAQVRKEAIEAERFERRRKWKKRLGVVGAGLSKILKSITPPLSFFKFIVTIALIPVYVVLGAAAGILVIPFMIVAASIEDDKYPWQARLP